MSKISADDVFPVKKVRVEMEVPLDEAMVEHRGMRAAQLQGTVEAVETEIKIAKEHLREKEKRRDALEAEVRELQRQIREAKGKSWVDAEERANFTTNQVDTIALDGPMYGVVIATREMSAEERQLAIDVDADLPPRDPPKQVKVKRNAKADAAPPTH